MDIRKIKPRLEAMLFAAGEPIDTKSLAQALEIEEAAAEMVLEHMASEYSERGITLLKLGSSWQLATRAEYAEDIRRLLDTRRDMPLSAAALEVLAIIAYNQPVTRGYISQVRGVECGETVERLAERGLVEECGRLDAPGRPRLFATTPDFLRVFGLSSLDELPRIHDKDGQIDFAEVGG